MMPPRIASTARAFFTSGGLNACTPSATASMPVKATAPDANACSTTNIVSGSNAGGGAAVTADGAGIVPNR